MVTYLNKKVLFGLLVTLTLIKSCPALSAAASHESERFEIFTDPKNTRIRRVPIVRHLPTKEQMKIAEEDYKRGELKLLGRPITTLWGTIEEVDKDLPEGLRLLRKAAYYGHPKACSFLVGCFRRGHSGVSKNEIFAAALSTSSKEAQDLWEASQRYLEEGKEIPTKTLTLPEIWGPIERDKKDSEEKAALKAAEEERAAVTTSEDIRLHLESKEPEENATVIDTKETKPLLGKDGLHHRYPSYYPGD